MKRLLVIVVLFAFLMGCTSIPKENKIQSKEHTMKTTIDGFEISTTYEVVDESMVIAGNVKNIGEKRYIYLIVRLQNSAGTTVAAHNIHIGSIEPNETKTFSGLSVKKFVTAVFDRFDYEIDVIPPRVEIG